MTLYDTTTSATDTTLGVQTVLVQEHGVPVRQACQAVRLSRAAYYRPPRSRLIQDAEVVTALNEVVGRHSRWGFWKCFYRLRRAGHRWNHKRVHRVYCALRLNLPRRTKRRGPARPLPPPVGPPPLQPNLVHPFHNTSPFPPLGVLLLQLLY